jgi:hypothetical protein
VLFWGDALNWTVVDLARAGFLHILSWFTWGGLCMAAINKDFGVLG